MKAAIAACLALSAVASVALADPVPHRAVPMQLSAAQLDAVTAGAAVSVAIAEANALGVRANTDTDTRTTVISNRAVEIAIAIAHGRASGESPDVNTLAWTYSDGDIVAQKHVQAGHDGPRHAVSTAFSITVARKQ